MSQIRSVLVVEDSELLHRMYDLVFRRYRDRGTRLLHAYNGKEALAVLAKQADVDLILLDINMPVMSGLEFLQHIRREKIFQGIPIVIVSTEGKEGDTVRGLEAGATAYVTKPFQPADLYRIIDRIYPPAEPRPAVIAETHFRG